MRNKDRTGINKLFSSIIATLLWAYLLLMLLFSPHLSATSYLFQLFSCFDQSISAWAIYFVEGCIIGFVINLAAGDFNTQSADLLKDTLVNAVVTLPIIIFIAKLLRTISFKRMWILNSPNEVARVLSLWPVLVLCIFLLILEHLAQSTN